EQTTADLSTDLDAVGAACEAADALVHLAGENEVLAARDPATAMSGTLAASQRIAETAEAVGVRRLVYMSTVHVYGERMEEGAVLTEDLRPEPRSPYAIARLASEHALAAAAGP